MVRSQEFENSRIREELTKKESVAGVQELRNETFRRQTRSTEEESFSQKIAKITKTSPSINGRHLMSTLHIRDGRMALKVITLCDLCITDIEDRAISRGFLGSHFCKLFDVSTLGRVDTCRRFLCARSSSASAPQAVLL